MILPCNCQSTFQDREHGKGMRVHNPCKLKNTTSSKGWRCTVCSREKPVGSGEKPVKGEK